MPSISRLANVQGATGPTGAAGAAGNTGATGATGPKIAGQIFLSAAGGWPSTTNGAAAVSLTEMATNKENVYTIDFADAVTSYAEWALVMPSDWDGGTVTASFYWFANDTTTNVVKWGLQGYAFGDGTALDSAWGTAITVTDANASTANQLRISAATSAITIGGTPAASKVVQFRAERVGGDGSDTLTATARLMGIMVTYTRS